MGFGNRIEIDKESRNNRVMKIYSYKELTSECISEVVLDKKIKYIQIAHNLPREAFLNIDNILAQRPDITFRIYGSYNENFFDLNVLSIMPHLQGLRLEMDLLDNAELLNWETLCTIKTLKSLFLDIFNLKNYSFIKELPKELEELGIIAETMKGGIMFDCKWLVKFQKLRKLYLGKMAKKNITAIAELPTLKDLSLRGIKLPDFNFIHEKELESLAILWCGMNDLSSLCGFDSLKSLELWRIMKLEDISFISTLTNLEILKLQDLSHIHCLPDVSELKHLKKIILINMRINEALVSNELKPLIRHW